MARIVLFDLDGTLSNDEHRQHLYVAGEYKEYFSYEAQMGDTAYPEGRALFDEMIGLGWEPAYLSARLERNRRASDDWLKREGFPHPERLMLRPELYSFMRPARFKSLLMGGLLRTEEYDDVTLVDNDINVVERITEEHGARHVHHAKWGAYEVTASIERAKPVAP